MRRWDRFSVSPRGATNSNQMFLEKDTEQSENESSKVSQILLEKLSSQIYEAEDENKEQLFFFFGAIPEQLKHKASQHHEETQATLCWL